MCTMYYISSATAISFKNIYKTKENNQQILKLPREISCAIVMAF